MGRIWIRTSQILIEGLRETNLIIGSVSYQKTSRYYTF